MESVERIYRRAKLLYEQGSAATALELLSVQLREDPHDARLLELKGVIHHALGEYESGQAAIERAGRRHPTSAAAQLALADCYCFTGKQDRARSLYCRLASRNDVPFELLSPLAMRLGRLREFQKALDVCRRGFDGNPGCHHARYGVAFYMSKCGYPPELIYPVLQRTLDLAPSVFHYRMSAATILCNMKQYDRAYLTIADATADELASVTCRCCLERLIGLYKSSADTARAGICGRQLTNAGSEC